MRNKSHFAKCIIQFNVSESSPYQSGIWQSWETNGVGFSSAYANYTLTFTSTESDMQLEHETNITTRLNLDGNYILLGGTEKQVNITCEILNENEPALANNIDVYFDFDGDTQTQNWIVADSPTITDYGNGTYTIDFIADTQTRNAAMHVSAQVNDTRNIFVMANVTCVKN